MATTYCIYDRRLDLFWDGQSKATIRDADTPPSFEHCMDRAGYVSDNRNIIMFRLANFMIDPQRHFPTPQKSTKIKDLPRYNIIPSSWVLWEYNYESHREVLRPLRSTATDVVVFNMLSLEDSPIALIWKNLALNFKSEKFSHVGYFGKDYLSEEIMEILTDVGITLGDFFILNNAVALRTREQAMVAKLAINGLRMFDIDEMRKQVKFLPENDGSYGR